MLILEMYVFYQEKIIIKSAFHNKISFQLLHSKHIHLKIDTQSEFYYESCYFQLNWWFQICVLLRNEKKWKSYYWSFKNAHGQKYVVNYNHNLMIITVLVKITLFLSNNTDDLFPPYVFILIMVGWKNIQQNLER